MAKRETSALDAHAYVHFETTNSKKEDVFDVLAVLQLLHELHEQDRTALTCAFLSVSVLDA